LNEPEDDADEALAETALVITLTDEDAGGRLDKALAMARPDLSRARLQALMAQGALSRDGVVVDDA
jgi:23S rRNA pseudouridine1911/1915/1917 synthase